jgi:hypothetical protein
MQKHTFISYSREDLALRDRITLALKEAHLTVWHDGEILPGSHFPSVIQRNIINSACVLLVITANSLQSEFVLAEAYTARQNNIPVIPIFYGVDDDNVSLKWNVLIQNIQRIQINESNFDSKIVDVISAIKSYSHRITKVLATFN